MAHMYRRSCSVPSGQCGIFFLLPQQAAAGGGPTSLPLVGSSVAATCRDLYAETKVKQLFHNDTGRDIEKAVYSFPLHNRACVNAFEVEIDGVVTHGRVLEKNQAEREFDDAVAGGGSAQLLQEESRDVFQMSIGGLKPGQTVSVRLTHVSVLRIVGDAVEVFVPTYVAPRYKGPPVAGADAAGRTELTLEVECHMASEITAIASDTHPITTLLGTEDGKQHGSFKLAAGAMQLNKDFVAMITTAQPHQPRVFLETSALDGSTTAAVTLAPKLEFEDCKAEFVFVVDRSGSMGGSGIAQARSALTLFLRSLPCDCYFNIVGFGSTFEKLFPASVKLDSTSLGTATAHVHSLAANLGGTEILQPVLAALGATAIEGYARQVFVLTDGQVGNTDEVVAAVGREQSARCFALGFGHRASRGLVEGIAKAGRGSSDFVIGDELDRAVVSQLKRAMQPSLTETQLEWTATTAEVAADGGGEAGGGGGPGRGGSLLAYTSPAVAATKARPKSLQAPQVVPPVFSDERIAVFVLDADPTTKEVVITSNTPDGPLTVKLPVASRSTGSVLQTLAGREAISDLECGRSWLSRDGRVPGADEAKAEIVKLGTTLGLVSKHTSYLSTQPATMDSELDRQLVAAGATMTRHRVASSVHTMSATMMTGSSVMDVMHSAPKGSAKRGGGGGWSLFGGSKKGRQASVANRSAPITMAAAASLSERAPPMPAAAAPPPPASPACAPPMPAAAAPPPPAFRKKKPKAKPSGAAAGGSGAAAASADPLQRLILLQEFDGAFALTDGLAAAVGKPLPELEAVATAMAVADKAVFAAMIALSYLRAALGGRRNEWELVARKTRKWLSRQPQNGAETNASTEWPAVEALFS